MSIKLHSVVESPNGAAIHAQLYHLGIEHEYNRINTFAGETKTEEFAKISPLQQIPVLQDGDITVWESSAIQRYIMRKFPNEEFYPTEGQAGASQDFVHTFESTTLKTPVARVYQGFHIFPNILKKPVPEGDALKELYTNLNVVLDQLQKIQTAIGGDYLTGDTFTLADLTVWSTLFHIVSRDLVDMTERQDLKAWYERCSEQKGCLALREKIESIQAA